MTAEISPGTEPHLSREERRHRTEAAILTAARTQFSAAGYERTTIRSVAAAAGIDPALVMQHFGSKERLFAEAARWPVEQERVLSATAADLPRAALEDAFGHFETSSDQESAAALMRNCLTHPSAATVMRDEVMCDRIAAIRSAMDGPDAELRASLFGACMMGLMMTRYLIQSEPLASAAREDVVRLFEPVLRALVEPPTGPSQD